MEWYDDVNEDFLNLAGLYAKPEFVESMKVAIHTSFFKYGTVLEKPPELLKKFRALELKKFVETGNHERLVNAANYDMFLYTVERPDEKYIQHAIQMMEEYKKELHIGTDSDQSVTRIMKPVSEWLREDILNE